MRVANDFGKVRIVYDGSPFEVAHDVRVEWLVDDEWKLYKGINSLSDDYAITNAREAADRAIKILAAESAKAFA
jgi:acid phosphatase class B